MYTYPHAHVLILIQIYMYHPHTHKMSTVPDSFFALIYSLYQLLMQSAPARGLPVFPSWFGQYCFIYFRKFFEYEYRTQFLLTLWKLDSLAFKPLCFSWNISRIYFILLNIIWSALISFLIFSFRSLIMACCFFKFILIRIHWVSWISMQVLLVESVKFNCCPLKRSLFCVPCSLHTFQS